MSSRFGKLWHLAIIWATRKAFQCILQGVRFLLANHTRLSPTSENESYPLAYISYPVIVPRRHKIPLRNLPDFRDGDDDRVSNNDRDGPELLLQRASAYRGSSVGSQVRIFISRRGSISSPNFEGKKCICNTLYLTSNHCLPLSLTD